MCHPCGIFIRYDRHVIVCREAHLRSYSDFFRIATGDKEPYPFQTRPALADTWSPLLEIPTGLGKTETIVGAYLYRTLERRLREPRLVMYTLPMRSLVEQTITRIESMTTNLRQSGLYKEVEIPTVQSLLGGDVSTDWIEQPERRAIVVATQDMALSYALNRGYAVSRFKWPMAFGSISNDVLYIVDEVQLHGIGATTAAQLQGLSERFGVFGTHRTVFVSATIDRTRIDTVDHPLARAIAANGIVALNDDDIAHPRVKKLLGARKRVETLAATDERAIADGAIAAHRDGTLTLVIVNTVKRARAIYTAIASRRGPAKTLLMHSRFRAKDRIRLADELYNLDATQGADAIIVATQVVEAGVDVSALTLVSDVAPWSSIVQRLGRCNRRGEQNDDARFIWIDDSALKPAPYEEDECAAARALLQSLEGESASPERLSSITAPHRKLGDEAVLRVPEMLDLFDTTTDLSGNDVDVSRFIRDGDETSVFVFWRDEPPTKIDPPRRDELCPAPRDEVHAILDKLANPDDARTINPLARDRAKGGSESRWQRASKPLRFGEIVWLSTSVGCYDKTSGFDPAQLGKTLVAEVSRETKATVSDVADESIDDDGPTYTGVALTLAQHSAEAREEAQSLTSAIATTELAGFTPDLADAVIRAAHWHDVGKAHPVFQRTMEKTLERAHLPVDGGPWAKSVGFGRHERPHFRHELASALSWLHVHADAGDPNVDLIAYLIAAHHGKLRMSAYTLAGEHDAVRTILGIQDGEKMPAVHIADDLDVPEFPLDLRHFFVGVGEAGPAEVWDDRVLRLRDETVGPFRLAYLETLVRLADWRASARHKDLAKRDASIAQADEPASELVAAVLA